MLIVVLCGVECLLLCCIVLRSIECLLLCCILLCNPVLWVFFVEFPIVGFCYYTEYRGVRFSYVIVCSVIRRSITIYRVVVWSVILRCFALYHAIVFELGAVVVWLMLCSIV